MTSLDPNLNRLCNSSIWLLHWSWVLKAWWMCLTALQLFFKYNSKYNGERKEIQNCHGMGERRSIGRFSIPMWGGMLNLFERVTHSKRGEKKWQQRKIDFWLLLGNTPQDLRLCQARIGELRRSVVVVDEVRPAWRGESSLPSRWKRTQVDAGVEAQLLGHPRIVPRAHARRKVIKVDLPLRGSSHFWKGTRTKNVHLHLNKS